MTNPATSGVELPEMDLLRKFDVPAPRYTSYPTADRFNASFGAEDYRKALAGRADAKEPSDLSLYVPSATTSASTAAATRSSRATTPAAPSTSR